MTKDAVNNPVAGLAGRKLVLASRSPRRRALLRDAGFSFEVVPPAESAECGLCSGESTPELVARLAWQKAMDVVSRVDRQSIVIGCDTVADLHGQVLGKPQDREHAEQILRMLSGHTHFVFSGLCVVRSWDRKHLVRVVQSELYLHPLSDEQLQEYLDSGAWEGKAGAFGYQDGHPWIELLSGPADNVVGLPVETLREMLSELVQIPESTD